MQVNIRRKFSAMPSGKTFWSDVKACQLVNFRTDENGVKIWR